MKATVIIPFTDKEHMDNVYYQGDTFEGSEERINELVNSGHVKVDETEKKPTRRRTAKAKEV